MTLLSRIVTTLEKLNSKISLDYKQRLTESLVFLLVINGLFGSLIFGANWWMLEVLIGSSLAFCFFAILVKKEFIEKCSYKRSYFFCFEIIGLSFFINSFYFGVLSYFAIGFLFSVVLPMLHMAMCCEGYEKIFLRIVKGILCSYIFFLIVSFIFGPRLSYHYSSLFMNPNILGYYLIIVSSSVIWLLYKNRLNRRHTLVLSGLLSSILIFCFFSASRTGLFSIIMQIMCVLILAVFLNFKKVTWESVIDFAKNLLSLAIVFVSTLVVIFTLFVFVKPSINEEFMQSVILGKHYLVKGIEESGINVDSFTSGRVGIWKSYLENVRFLGHATEERYIVSGPRIYNSTNAHNVYLQMSYSAGIVCGFTMMALVALAVKDVFVGLWMAVKRRKISIELLFVSLCVSGFIFPSMTSSGYMPFVYLPATLFYFAISYLAIEKGNAHAKNINDC